MVPQNMANVTDIKKARLLFKSIRETNPKLPQGKAQKFLMLLIILPI